jgi:nucleoside-diphosphate-sugar epimerase
MRIFVTGASGWIGSAVVPELIGAGHRVLGLARSDASAEAVAGMGADVLRGDLTDAGILRAGTLDSDGVIHLVFMPGRPGFEAAVQADAAAIETFADSLAGSGKPMLISGATMVTPGRPAVHVEDAASLYRLAVEQAPAGAVLNAVGDEGVPVRQIAEAIGRNLNLPARSLPAEEYAGMLVPLLSTDMPASSTITQDLLGWKPTHPGLIADIEQGHYFT